MKGSGFCSFFLGIVVLVAGTRMVAAEDTTGQFVPKDVTPAAVAAKSGWDLQATVGASTAFNDNRNVVGQPTGGAFMLGFLFNGAANYLQGPHECRSTLALTESFARTPVVTKLVKSSDMITLESIYIYHIIPWLGPFARVHWDTAMLPGRDVRTAATKYTITHRDGTTKDVTGSELRLTDPFAPMTIKESLGAVAQPTKDPAFQTEFRLGAGGQEVLANGQYLVADASDAANIKIGEMKSFSQAGAEAAAAFWGVISDNRVSYKLTAEAMVPFLRQKDTGDNRSAFSMTNLDFKAKLSFKLVSWASLDYELRIFRQPQLLDMFQYQNNLLLTFSYTLLKGS